MLALTLLTGCGLNGDFGRMRTSLQSDDTHAWLGPAVYRPAVPVGAARKYCRGHGTA